MIGRTTLGLAAGALILTAAVAIPVLELASPAPRDASPAAIEVDEPTAAELALPETSDDGIVVGALEPRPWPVPRYRPAARRGVLEAALTVVPPAPAALVEPSAPETTRATAADVRLTVPELEVVELPVPGERRGGRRISPGPETGIGAGDAGSSRAIAVRPRRARFAPRTHTSDTFRGHIPS